MTVVGTGATAVDQYLSLDVSSQSACGQALMERVSQESTQTHLPLTAPGDEGALSGGLTPAMNQWLMTRITPSRGPALAELESQARGIKIGNNVDGVL